MIYRAPNMSQAEIEAVAAILALGDGPWEPMRGCYMLGVIDEPAATPEPPTAKRAKVKADGRGVLFKT